MSFVERFGPHIPFLRRYTRALTGSQHSGDAYVHASLLALKENPEAIPTGLTDRLALFQYCHAIWETTGEQLSDDIADDSADARLQALAPKPRQAFLLSSMEGFTNSEAASILRISVDDLNKLITEAIAEIETDLATRVLVIEDEPIIAADLESIVEGLGHTVTGNAVTHKEAVELAKRDRPGLILCDIQLADDSSGLDAIDEILGEFDAPVIFITAYPERLLTGQRGEPAYLIAKPFKPDAVKAAISQALFFFSPAEA
jgi:CheY-like chemotaxis protein